MKSSFEIFVRVSHVSLDSRSNQAMQGKRRRAEFLTYACIPRLEDVYPIHPLEDIHPVNILKLDLKI